MMANLSLLLFDILSLQSENITLHMTFLELPIYRHGFHSHPQPEKQDYSKPQSQTPRITACSNIVIVGRGYFSQDFHCARLEFRLEFAVIFFQLVFSLVPQRIRNGTL